MSGYVVHFSLIQSNTYPLRGWVVAIKPGIVGLPPVTGEFKQLPPAGRLVYRVPEGETIIARAELLRSKITIVQIKEARCVVRNARTNQTVDTVDATFDTGRISAPIRLDQGIYDILFEIVLLDDSIVTMIRPIRLLVGPAT